MQRFVPKCILINKQRLFGIGRCALRAEKDSGFHRQAPPIQTYLVQLRVDTLILVGGSTSGCVRAAAVDGVTRGWNVAVVEECTYDRIQLSHKAALLDMWMKYCDVVKFDEVKSYLEKFVAARTAAG